LLFRFSTRMCFVTCEIDNVAIVVVSCVALCLCWCALSAACCYYFFSRSSTRSSAWIDALQKSLTYTTVRGNFKTRVIWDCDETTVRDLFGEGVDVDVEGQPSTISVTNSDTPSVHESTREIRRMPFSEYASSADDATSVLHPAYPDKSPVEYYSSHHKRWFQATLNLSAICEGTGDEQICSALLYDVHISYTHQDRYNVQLAVLRHAFQQNDTVEVETSSGWKPGVIKKVVRGKPPFRSFLVVLGDTEVVVEGISVRHLFPVGSAVRVYRGFLVGWVPGIAQDPQLPRPDSLDVIGSEELGHDDVLASSALHSETIGDEEREETKDEMEVESDVKMVRPTSSHSVSVSRSLSIRRASEASSQSADDANTLQTRGSGILLVSRSVRQNRKSPDTTVHTTDLSATASSEATRNHMLPVKLSGEDEVLWVPAHLVASPVAGHLDEGTS